MGDGEPAVPAVAAAELAARARQLLDQLKERPGDELAWEIGFHIDALAESLKESAARCRGLEEDKRQLQDRLRSQHRGYAELRASMDELLNLHELTEKISTSFAIADIIESLMDLSARCMPYESCSVFSLGADAGLEVMARRGDSRAEDSARAHWQDGIVDWVMREQRPVVVEDMGTVDSGAGQACCTVLTPLQVRGRCIGLYALYCRRAKDEFTAGEMELLSVLANQTAIALENARLYSQLEESRDQLRASQQQLLLAEKMAVVGRLAGGVAHEVNNPLQIILSRVQLMRMQHGAMPQVVEGLGLVEHNVRRIAKIIRGLLGFAGHVADEREWGPCDVEQGLRQTLELVQPQLDEAGVHAALSCAAELSPIGGNMGELEQVFINLIVNAKKAMPNGGQLQISARQIDEKIEVCFADTGVGMTEEVLEHIFDPFFTTRPHEGGTGLGLSVSYGIVERHGGSIEVDSTCDHGARFTLRFPRWQGSWSG